MKFDDFFYNHELLDQVTRQAKLYQDLLAPEYDYSAIVPAGATAGCSAIALAHPHDFLPDLSWMYETNFWETKIVDLISTEAPILSGLSEMSTSLTKLIDAEYQTGLLGAANSLMDTMDIVNVSGQIASIQDRWEELYGMAGQFTTPVNLLDDYADFAIRQHEAIQRAVNGLDGMLDVQWRLDVLDVASRFVDRQVQWTSQYIADNEDRIIDTDAVVIDEEEAAEVMEQVPESIVSAIPQHIAYTKREDVEVSPEEAFADSKIVHLTEKGKLIAENIRAINDCCNDAGRAELFKFTGKVFTGGIDLSTVVCNNKTNFGVIVDSLYFIFYENLKSIKVLIGNGDESVGDRAVREEEIYQCIFRVKDLRTDLRHDIEHGKDRDIKKKQQNIGDAYRHYCKKRPQKSSEYMLLQKNLYDEFMVLQEHLIGIIQDAV